MQMIDFINKSFTGDNTIHKNKSGANIVKAYKIFLIAHNGSGFDLYIVMNNLDKNMTSLKKDKTERGLIKLSFRSGYMNETPQYIIVVCTKSPISRPLAEIGRKYVSNQS